MVNAPPWVIEATKRHKIREALMELLIKEKKEKIRISCGLKVLDQIMKMSDFTYINEIGFINMVGCYIEVQRDFDLDPWNIVHKGEVIFN
jgi:hypothetical protein